MRYKILEVFTPNDQTTSSGLRSISWILHTTLDKTTHLSALRSLISMPELAEFPPTLAVDCFYIFIRCLYLLTRESVIEPLTRELGQLATLSTKSLVRTVYHLSVTDPTSGILAGLRQCYNSFFLPTRISGVSNLVTQWLWSMFRSGNV